MEVNKTHSSLKEMYNGKNTKQAFNFEFVDDNEKVKLIFLFRKGFWSVMPFGFYSKNILALKLIPQEPVLNNAPVVLFNNTYQECFTHAPNLKSVISMTNLILMENKDLLEYLQEDIKEGVELSKPFFGYAGGGDLDFLRQFLFSESNQKRFENPSVHIDDFYKEFWDYYYDTPEQKKAFELFKKLRDDVSYLADYGVYDYGVWNNYVRNVFANRAYSRISIEDKNKWQHFWHCAQLPHGFDCDDNSFESYKISPGNSESLIRFFSDSFNSGWEEQYEIFPKEVQNHPIFEATEAIRLNRQYPGEKHLAAATRLEEEYNDPVASWNALISASYWAGRMGRLDIIEEAWQKAINLSEKHNWSEINEVLKDQFKFYNHYKDIV